jgi:hypothetical protein
MCAEHRSLNADFAVARLLPDGTLDTEFTDTGVMSIDFSHLTDIAEGVAITPDGEDRGSGQARGTRDGYGVVRRTRRPLVLSSEHVGAVKRGPSGRG